MKKILLDSDNLKIWQDGDSYFAIYDAGAHLVKMRKDEISEEEAKLACSGFDSATKMLFALQKRLIESGLDPYESNYKLED